MTGRVVAGALGLAGIGTGLAVLLTDPHVRDPLDVAVWLVAALLLHDAVLVPLVLLVGAALRARGPLRGGLIVGGCLTAVALPAVLRPGPVPVSLLPLDYVRNWLFALGAVAVVTALAAGWALLRSRWGRRARR
ncbi:hypothetical protein NGB36_04180 [Streptomyces sp. RB6PN25]|uniref:Lipoprotein n=1 Tax=Streptomyces humicola TaxID=2953240 RepID=A0ABT1PRQ2_9ACTN|nr:hypothetical protein [Streptomyces humicola]MCQ4079808.1 hypothetical protein [Streptomyces humicola]